MKSDKQGINKVIEPGKGWRWPKGVSGNPKGRPKGKTMKEYARMLLERLTDEERLKFLDSLPPELVWRMAEGNPKEEQAFDKESIEKLEEATLNILENLNAVGSGKRANKDKV